MQHCSRLSLIRSDFPHEHARSRTFRWGEDGIAGVSDNHGFQNIAFAFWNEKEFVPHITVYNSIQKRL